MRPSAIEHLRQRLALTRRTDVHAHDRRERDRQTPAVVGQRIRAKALVDLIRVPARRRVEAAHDEQLVRRHDLLSPPVQPTVAVQQRVGGREGIREL